MQISFGSLGIWRNRKLAASFYGLYQGLTRVGYVAYRLKLPSTAHLYLNSDTPSIHMSSFVLPPQLAAEWKSISYMKLFGNLDMISVGSCDSHIEVLIKWKDLGPFEASWEDFEVVNNQFFDFHLENNVTLIGSNTD
ncbi:hypothetical protein OSB04_001462 [Centaurea solstitialis]|uniref:Chromo domain-containing protein n=1 Tax=Centaurea solstitialis TaxID=347529 RepID=A0AA38U1L7_9ASTR|nr:hypothetical protein OSB04_001462 [Centaurea solstitialis]